MTTKVGTSIAYANHQRPQLRRSRSRPDGPPRLRSTAIAGPEAGTGWSVELTDSSLTHYFTIV